MRSFGGSHIRMQSFTAIPPKRKLGSRRSRWREMPRRVALKRAFSSCPHRPRWKCTTRGRCEGSAACSPSSRSRRANITEPAAFTASENSGERVSAALSHSRDTVALSALCCICKRGSGQPTSTRSTDGPQGWLPHAPVGPQHSRRCARAALRGLPVRPRRPPRRPGQTPRRRRPLHRRRAY
jgi:hypothetical protein